MARAILALRDVSPTHARTVVGFGGGHYAPRFDRILRETDWRVGHVAADWALEEIGNPEEARGVVRKAFETSGAEFALVEGEHPRLEAVIEDLGFERVSETWLRETTGVPLPLVERLERELMPVAAGLRLGEPAEGYDGEYVTGYLPEELTEEAAGIDREATRDAVEGVALAYETAESGTIVAGRVALADAADRRRIVESLAPVLEPKYDTVDVREAAVVASREAFDPALARAAGVEEGPAFGRLSGGEPVEVDGETVLPDDVRSARERRFPR